MDAPLDRRTRRRQERAEQVYAAAIRLFAQRGYEATTMDDIADEADVGRGSVFNYYPRKRAFLDEWIARRRAQAKQAAEADVAGGHSLDAVLRRYMDGLAAVNVAHRAETVALMPAALAATDLLRELPLADELVQFLRAAESRGELRTTVDPAQAALILATAYYGTIAAWTGGEPAPFDLRARLHGLVDVVTVGILASR
jgi:AcrR family transcriptional regulator